ISGYYRDLSNLKLSPAVEVNGSLNGLPNRTLTASFPEQLLGNPLITDTNQLLGGLRTIPSSEPDLSKLNQLPALDVNALLNGLPNRTLTGGLPNQLQYRAASELPMSSRDSTSGMGLNGIATLVWPNLSRHLIGNLSVLM